MVPDAELVPLSVAYEMVDREIGPIALETERIATGKARGRTVIEDQISFLDLPPFDKSAMDGYALAQGEERERYRLIESVRAGEVPGRSLGAGEATKVMTGAPIPQGTGRVVKLERTTEREGIVQVHSPDRSVNICRQGEDVRRGDLILRAPRLLGALEVANLIACGIHEVNVTRRLRAALICTGDEIVDSPAELGPGKIMNSNGPLLAGLCEENGLEVVDTALVRDDRPATLFALRNALGRADLVVVSGGVSVGEFDFVGGALPEAGLRVHFSRVAVKPGKPTTFASDRQRAVFGLPGNPVSVFLMFHLFVLRAARLMTGLRAEARHVELPLEHGFTRRMTERLEYVPCRLTPGGELQQLEFHGSAHLSAMIDADGFFVVPRGVTELGAKGKVSFLPMKGTGR